MPDSSNKQDFQLQAKNLLIWINRYYFRFAFGIPLGVIAVLYSGVIANKVGYPEVNFLLALLFILSAGALAFHPVIQLIRAGGHAISSAFPSFTSYVRAVIHVLLFMGLAFSVLGTLKIENIAAVLPVFIILLLVGFAFYLWPNRVWYKRIVWFILIKLFVLWAVWAYVSADTISFVQDQYRKVVEEPIVVDHVVISTKSVELTDFVDRNSDGIMQDAERVIRKVKAGCYRFSATGPDVVWDHHPTQIYDLSGIIRINGNDANRSFRIKEAEPVIVSFDPSFGKGHLIQTGPGGYEVVKITLTPSGGSDCGV